MQNSSTEKTALIDAIKSVKDFKQLSTDKFPLLADEIRRLIIDTVSSTGGHLGANLGIVEVTMALHYVLNSPNDKIVWDVGHQCYVHKILTGRADRMSTIRQTHGLSGFPNIFESEHDHFTVGHASTSISQALGLAAARDLRGSAEKVVAVIGDGSFTGGMCYEALNNAGHMKTPCTVILNDNKMAISKSTGAMSKYLSKIMAAPLYNRLRSEIENQLEKFQLQPVKKFLKHTEEGLKNLIVPGMIFEELGWRYFGPIDGHDIELLIETLENVLKINVPCILHVITQKGKGYEFAEKAPHKYHSAAPFDVSTGKPPIREADADVSTDDASSYTKAFSDSLMNLSEEDEKILAITAAMPEGTGLTAFHEKFEKRFFDVGIAEEHALTFGGALAKGGYKPVCAIYSTFMQRAYDQMVHDVALQNANVTVCMDRAGLVGADGPTHHGLFDFSFTRNIPGSVVSAPFNESEMRRLLELGVEYPGIFTIRYPKATIPKEPVLEEKEFAIGEAEVLIEGSDVMFLAIGNMVSTACEAAEKLRNEKIKAGLSRYGHRAGR